MKVHADITESGALTAGKLHELLDQVPADATIVIKCETDGRDGTKSWSFKAEWDHPNRVKFPIHQPAYRGQGQFGDH